MYCVLYQTNQLSLVNYTDGTTFNANKYESGVNGACMTVPQAQYELIRDNKYFKASTPIYPMDFVKGANIHISSKSQKLLGYYEGLAVKRILDGHDYDIGLYVSKVTKVNNNTIKIELHTPCPPIVIDTESVVQADNYGFSVITSNNENIIESVNLANHYSNPYIIIKTTKDCTGAKLRYGVNGENGESGYEKGSRGNIRDSQGDSSVAYINDVKVKIHNWLYFFEKLI